MELIPKKDIVNYVHNVAIPFVYDVAIKYD